MHRATLAESSSQEVVSSSLDGRVVELSSGVDALYLSGRGDLCGRWLSRLDELREAAADFGGPVPLELDGLLFAVLPHGWGKYRYCLDHPIGRVGVTPSDHLPGLRIQPRSEFLHAVGTNQAVETFERLVTPLCTELRLGVSRVDLYVDLQGTSYSVNDRDRFVCRATSQRSFEEASCWTGFEFGRRSAKTICARVYDKTRDVMAKGSDWWYEIWADRFREGSPVHRVELEYQRQALAEFDLHSPSQVIESLGALWRYGTEYWITYRSPTKDSNRVRWPIASEWRVVQGAGLSQHVVDIDRMRGAARAGSCVI